MAPTFTTRLGATKPDPTDTYDVTLFNGNFDKFDADMGGMIVCTSLTRPSAPYGGQAIYETDTKNTYVRSGSAWVPVGIVNVANQTARTALTPYAGMEIWRLDRKWVEVYDTAWRVQGVALCTSASDRDTIITDPVLGQLAVATDTGILWQRQASSWSEYKGSSQPRGIVGWGQRTTTSSNSTSATPVAVLRVDNCSLVTGRLYKIVMVCTPNSSVGTDVIAPHVRFASGGTATTASTVLPGIGTFPSPGPSLTFVTYLLAASTALFSFLLAFYRNSGSGTANLFCDATRYTQLTIEDLGPTTDTGVDL